MYKRKPERKQLHQVDAKSPFFNGGAEIPRSPIEVGYAGEKSGGGNYQHNTRQTRKRGGYSCAPLGLITAWTLVLGGIGYFWLTSIRLPQQHLEFREKELEPVKHQWKQKVVLLEATLEDMERENKLLKASMDEDSKVLHIELQDVIGKLDRAKERVGVLEQSNREVEQRIRDFSRLAVLEK